MTMQSKYPTKKAFKQAIEDDPCAVLIEDPAVMQDWLKYGYPRFTLDIMQQGDSITVTNHPKRSWFAAVTCLGNGIYKVL